MRGVVLASLLLGLMLSGCLSDEPKTNEADPTSTSSGTTSSSSSGSKSSTATSGSGTGGAKPDLAPTATLAAEPSNGTAPLNVTFTVGGSDPEGAVLTWSLAVGNATGNATGTPIGNGTLTPAGGAYAPANVTHAFAAPGNFSVVLTLSDGKNTATANVTLQVAGGNGTVARGTQSFEVEWLVGAPGCALILTGDGDTNGVYGAWHDIDAATWGATFTIVFEAVPDSIGYEYAFYAGSTRLGVVSAEGTPPTATGVVPEDVTGIALRNCGGQGTSATYTAA